NPLMPSVAMCLCLSYPPYISVLHRRYGEGSAAGLKMSDLAPLGNTLCRSVLIANPFHFSDKVRGVGFAQDCGVIPPEPLVPFRQHIGQHGMDLEPVLLHHFDRLGTMLPHLKQETLAGLLRGLNKALPDFYRDRLPFFPCDHEGADKRNHL